MTKINIDKTNWTWKRTLKHFILNLFGQPVLKISDKFHTSSVRIGKNTSLGQRLTITSIGGGNTVVIGNNCNLNKKNSIFVQGNNNVIKLGDNIIFDQNVLLVAAEGTSLSIGNDCLFANGVQIRTSDQHPIFDEAGVRINPSADVELGNHVWVGASVMICKGVKIGDGSVIGARSFVTKDVPPYTIAAGVPAKVVKTNVRWSRIYDDPKEQQTRFGYK